MREENYKDFYEYELIDIEWSINYDLSEDYLPIKVQDDSSIKDSPQEEVNQKIEYAITHLPDGVPLIPPKTKGKKKAPHKK